MESMVKIVGRDSTCDYIVCDQGRKISRKHVLIRKTNEKYVIEELGSVNGTFVNGNKIMPGVPVPVDLKSEILLAGVYKLDLSEIFKVEDVKGGETQLLSYDSKMVNFQSGERQIQVDSNLSNLGIQHETDQTKFISIGRAKDNNVIIENGNISRYQCKIRLINPFSFEIVDLGSSNGTFVNNEKLKPNESKVFYSTDSVRFGKIYTAELDKILPGLKKISPQISHPASNIKGISNTLHMSEAEKEAFMNLESFPNYVFLCIDIHVRHRVKELKHVVGYVKFGGEVAVLSEKEVYLIKNIGKLSNTVIIHHEKLGTGDEVEIIEGHLRFLRGYLTRTNGTTMVQLEIPSLHCFANVNLEIGKVRKVY